jgi:hypothetical protein
MTGVCQVFLVYNVLILWNGFKNVFVDLLAYFLWKQMVGFYVYWLFEVFVVL